MARKPQPWRQRSQVVTIPAPYGGWNARDALTSMPPTDAIRLENVIPDTTGLNLRSGYDTHATDAGTRIDSLMAYEGPSTRKLFAANSDGEIWDVTATSSATNQATATAFSNGKFQHVMMGTGAGNYLVICNGADVPFFFDGTGWATASITSTAASTTFVNVTQHQSRLWFVQKDSMSAWYLGAASIQGTATEFPIGSYCRKGGYLQAIASWTRDGGAGVDDLLVFLTSQGEAVLYSGTDPTDSTTFAKVGTFNIPFPVGMRCVTQIGGDIAIITSQGVIPLSQMLPLSPGGAAKVAATDKISGAYQQAYANGGSMFGWQVIENQSARLLIVNVPTVENERSEQFVMNIMNGSWCKFKGINTNVWCTFGDQIYFGGLTDGKIYRYGASTADAGTNAISAVCTSAFTDLKVPNNKHFQMVRAVMVAPDGLSPGTGIHLDYATSNIAVVSTTYDSVGTEWDAGAWDSFQWAGGSNLVREWRTVNGIGTAVSVETQFESTDSVRFNSIDIMFEPGGYL